MSAGAAAADGLIERDGELPRLARLVEAVAAGRGGRAVIHGEAGVGKTRLLRHARELAREQGVDALWAQGSELEEEYAFGLASQLLEPAVGELEAEERDALFAGGGAMAAAILLGAPGDEAEGSADVSFARMRALQAVVAAIARRRPTLLLVDDAHWGDPASLRFLSFLTRRLSSLRLGLVVAARPVEDDVRRPLLESLLADPEAEQLAPRPLSRGGVERLLAERTGGADPAFAAACHDLTRGNPFLVDQVLRAAADAGLGTGAADAEALRALGPTSIARASLARLRRADPAAIDVARWIAVLGDAPEPALLAALAERADADVRAAVDALATAGLLEDDGAGRVRFHHPVVRTAIHGELPPGERSRRHGAAARELAARGAPPEAIVAHLLACEPAGDARTAAVLADAAERATALGAHDSAVAYLRRALAEPPEPAARGAVLLALGRAEGRSGDPRSLEHLLEGYALETTREVRVETGVELAATLMAADRFAAAVPLLDGLAEELAGPRPDLAARVEAALLNAARFDPGHADVAVRRRGSIDAHVARDPESAAARSLRAGLAFDAAMRARGREEVVGLADAALRGELLPWDMGRDLSFGMAVHALTLADELEAADRHLAWALERCRARGSAAGLAWLGFFRSFVGLRVGRLAEAERDAVGALEIAEVAGLRGWTGAALAFLLEIQLERGDADGARATHERLLGERDELRLPIVAVCAGRGEGLWRLHVGDAERALEAFEAVGRMDAGWSVSNSSGWSGWRGGAAAALRRLGRDEEARRLAADEVAEARAVGAPRALSRALRGAAAAGLGGREERAALLEEALACARAGSSPLELAWAAHDLGAARRRDGTPAAARELLAEALALAERCEAGALAASAREELLAAGARPRRAAVNGREALTPSELRVARLAAGGRTNAQVAAELVVTRKTVEMHLRNIFRKLGISSRVQLADALGEDADAGTDGPGAPAAPAAPAEPR